MCCWRKKNQQCLYTIQFFIVFFFYWTFCSKSHLTKVLRRKTKTQKTLFTVMTCLHLTRRCRLDHEHWAVLSILFIAEESFTRSVIPNSQLHRLWIQNTHVVIKRSHFFCPCTGHCSLPQSLFDLDELWFFLFNFLIFFQLWRKEKTT